MALNWHLLPIFRQNSAIAANLKTRLECGTQFYARSDAKYCTVRCRQRAYHRRQKAAK